MRHRPLLLQSLNTVGQDGKFRMRTLDELDVKDVFPSDYITKKVLDDAKRRCEQDNRVEHPYICIEPPRTFLNSWRNGRSWDAAESESFSPRPSVESDTIIRKFASTAQQSQGFQRRWTEEYTAMSKKLRDQIVNVLSMGYSNGHVGEDVGSSVMSTKYVFGLTYETKMTRDDSDNTKTLNLNRKFRCRVVSEQLLLKLAIIGDNRVDINHQPVEYFTDAHKQYAKTRLADLKRLAELWTKQLKPPDGCDLLMGAVFLTIPGAHRAGADHVDEMTIDENNDLRRCISPTRSASSSNNKNATNTGEPLVNRQQPQRRPGAATAAAAASADRRGRSPSASPARQRKSARKAKARSPSPG